MSSRAKVLPEIFDIIFTHLDTTSLLNAILVCRSWHDNAWHCLWRHIHHPMLLATFFDQLARHGHRVQSLSLLLNSHLGSHDIVPMELTRILRHTPRLTSLTLRLSHGGPQETVTSLLRVIQDLLGPNRPIHNNTTNILTKLDLDIGPITHEDAVRFFPAFQNTLTDLTLSGGVRTSVLQLVIHTLPGLHALASNERESFDREEGFTDETLRALGQSKKLPLLRRLAITANSHLTELGLSSFADSYQGLTSIDLISCPTIDTDGIERLVQKSVFLTHVRLNDTPTDDNVLRVLASPARAAQLRVLHVADCMSVTVLGLRQVVMSCANLEELDFSCAIQPLLGVFEGPLWSCTGLRVLRVGEQLGARSSSHLITDGGRRQMYKQLGLLGRLRELVLDNLGTGLQLWESGRADIESLKWLETLSLQRFAYKRKELIWLMTQLPGLRRLVITKYWEHEGLIKDLKDINKRLVVALEEFEADGSDNDSDDDDSAFFYNPHPLFDYGLATDSESESDGVEEEDVEDSLDDEVPATFAGHFLHNIVSIDSDDDGNDSNISSDHNIHYADSDEESIEESDVEKVEVYLEEHSAIDGSEESGDDDDDETIGYAHSTFSIYRSPYMSDDGHASDPDESDGSDGNSIGCSYSSFGAYRSFDEDSDDSEEGSESDQDDVSSADNENSDEDEIENSDEELEEEQEESEVDEDESQYDSDETPPPPYESDDPIESSDQDDDDEDVEDEESIVYTEESVEESDQSMPEESDVDVSAEEEEEELDEEAEEEEIDEEDEIEEEEDLDEEDEIDEGEEEDLDEVEEEVEEEEEEEEEYFDEENEIYVDDYDDEPQDEYDEDPYGDGSDDGNVYNDYDDID
ncbi:hypothetical protein BGZ81_008636 [Podila clonocystis]|nr:hypothetical protein BGZ81_008636 [Podila clonocystis]